MFCCPATTRRLPSGGSSSERSARRNADRIYGRRTRDTKREKTRVRRSKKSAGTGFRDIGLRTPFDFLVLPSRSERTAMTNKILEQVEQAYLKKDIPQFTVGDTVDVHTRIIEGEKERIQIFAGTVIMKKGRGTSETFTVRRIVNNEGVERIFPLHSPFISKVVVKRGGETRRAKLFYLRDRVGKAVKLTETKRTKASADGAADKS